MLVLPDVLLVLLQLVLQLLLFVPLVIQLLVINQPQQLVVLVPLVSQMLLLLLLQSLVVLLAEQLALLTPFVNLVLQVQSPLTVVVAALPLIQLPTATNLLPVVQLHAVSAAQDITQLQQPPVLLVEATAFNAVQLLVHFVLQVTL
jgi:hypothetical protein